LCRAGRHGRLLPRAPERPVSAEAPDSRGPRRRLPGDLTPAQLIDRVIRVDQAGEYSARRIYEGQLAVLPPAPARHATLRTAERGAGDGGGGGGRGGGLRRGGGR